jgi:3-methyl-2-oxobutanoate hydroxymethyltransferase
MWILMSITVVDVKGFKRSGSPFAMLTAYDYLMARALDEAGVPVLLVGDTLGIFVLGYSTTIPVTLDDVIHHCRAVSRGVENALIVGDMPFGSYQTIHDGIRSAGRLIQEGGAHAVKLEGPQFELVAALASAGIPVMGHLGLTPQSFNQFGGNKVQARTNAAVDQLIKNAEGLEAAGVFALVLEAVPSEAARRVTESLRVPSIGIGAGPHCDGQVLVSSEMLGLSSGARPRYAKLYANLRDDIVHAAKVFVEEVALRSYPDPEHSYDWTIK